MAFTFSLENAMPAQLTFQRLLAAALLGVTTACSSGPKAMPVTSTESVIHAVNVGDEVSITSKNGKLFRFVITKMTNKALYGDGYRVTYDEMATIERKNKDGVFTTIGNLF